MKKNYTNTPSFYNNESYFLQYLGKTSYYISLQNVLNRIIELLQPKRILELGCAVGTTTFEVWDNHNIPIDGVDMRQDVIDIAISKIEKGAHVNFHCADMSMFVDNDNLKQWDFIYMLYSFHHIIDPLCNKEQFLRLCYDNIKKGTTIAILETFLPQNSQMEIKDNSVPQLFERRALEGYASVFWQALKGLDENSINETKKAAVFTANNEKMAGDLVYKRENEYLVTPDWVTQIANKIGYNVILCEPINSVGEHLILLKK